jgi:hypothetical protein
VLPVAFDDRHAMEVAAEDVCCEQARDAPSDNNRVIALWTDGSIGG